LPYIVDYGGRPITATGERLFDGEYVSGGLGERQEQVVEMVKKRRQEMGG